MSKYRYNYAVIDPAYPEDQPKFWSLAGISLGDAEKINWTFDFAPDADATTELLLSNLSRSGNKITIAIPIRFFEGSCGARQNTSTLAA